MRSWKRDFESAFSVLRLAVERTHKAERGHTIEQRALHFVVSQRITRRLRQSLCARSACPNKTPIPLIAATAALNAYLAANPDVRQAEIDRFCTICGSARQNGAR
jgi:hypothetical protein